MDIYVQVIPCALIKEKYIFKTNNLNVGCYFRKYMAESLTKVMSVDIFHKFI